MNLRFRDSYDPGYVGGHQWPGPQSRTLAPQGAIPASLGGHSCLGEVWSGLPPLEGAVVTQVRVRGRLLLKASGTQGAGSCLLCSLGGLCHFSVCQPRPLDPSPLVPQSLGSRYQISPALGIRKPGVQISEFIIISGWPRAPLASELKLCQTLDCHLCHLSLFLHKWGWGGCCWREC